MHDDDNNGKHMASDWQVDEKIKMFKATNTHRISAFSLVLVILCYDVDNPKLIHCHKVA